MIHKADSVNLDRRQILLVEMAAKIFGSRKTSEKDAIRQADDLLKALGPVAETVLAGNTAATVFSASNKSTATTKRDIDAAVAVAKNLIHEA